MKIICTTSNRYLHILPIFCFLFNKFWGSEQRVEIVGYDPPKNKLPNNFSFYSLGQQLGDAKNFTRDLRKYFRLQDDRFVWLMEDTFFRARVDTLLVNILFKLPVTLKSTAIENKKIGRINLTGECVKQDHVPTELHLIDARMKTKSKPLFANTPVSLYRLSTQPSIWTRDYVLQYMQQDLTPWEFECQSDYQNDNWAIVGLNKEDAPVKHNEGVRKRDIYKYNFDGIDPVIIGEMKKEGIL